MGPGSISYGSWSGVWNEWIIIEASDETVVQNVDILMVFWTKTDSSFPIEQFRIQGYSEPYRLDRNGSGGGLLV